MADETVLAQASTREEGLLDAPEDLRRGHSQEMLDALVGHTASSPVEPVPSPLTLDRADTFGDELKRRTRQSDSDDESNCCCCLVWALSNYEHALAEPEQLEALHDELKSCSDKLDVQVLEETATAGALMQPRCGGEGPSAEDSVTRLGQLLCRWAARQDPPFGLRVGVHTGTLNSITLPSGNEGYFGDALSTARYLAESAPRDAVVHLSKATKEQLCVLERLSFTCTPSMSSYCLDPWTQVVEGWSGEESEVAKQHNTTRRGARMSTTALSMEESTCMASHRPGRRRTPSDMDSEVVGRPFGRIPSNKAAAMLPVSEFGQTFDEFRDYLTEHGVDTYQFGKNQARTLQEFYKRVVLERKSRLSVTPEGALEQHMALVRINLLTERREDGADYQLWLNSEILEDGRLRGRIQKLAHTLLEGDTWEEAMEQCFLERFRLEPRLLGDVLRVEPESYSYRSERSASQSTPGIMTTYMTHEVTVRVIDPTDPELAKIGLPEMEPFTTGPIVHAGIPESNWAWHTVGLTQEDLWHDGLTHLLTRHGIKADDYHSDALNDLWEEVHRGKYATLSVREDFELERRINIVKVWLCANILSLEHVLVRKFEVERGEKKFDVQDRPLTGRMTVDQSWESCVVDTVESKMGLEGAFQSMAISVDERSYRLSEEIGFSSKFPGMRTLYCIHEVRCRIHDPGSDGMEGLGLPDGHDFNLVRIKHAKKDNSGCARTITRWCWKPLAELMYSSQSFQHGLVDNPSCVNEKQEHKRRLPAPSPPRLPEEFSPDDDGSPASQTGCWVLAEVMRGKRPNSDRALNAAKKIRDANYTCRHFFDDCSKAFPELALYMVGAEDGTEALTSSGRTPDDEYQRTMGALFAVYWLMRRTIDGAQSFCFGVDNDWNPLSEKSPLPSRSPEELEKRRAFLEQMRWEDLEQLFLDAGLLRRDPEGPGGWSHDVERTLAMLVLTAIHDIMKVKALLPVDREGDRISDHDAALAFVLEHYPSVLPSFEMLPRASKQSVKFTQCKMEYNMGWLVQAEAPPGALFQKFKEMIMSGQVSGSDVAFYFVHWLTDLAGAEPCPQEGCEKFVLKFPQKVLASFLSSFSIVKSLASASETEVLEDYLLWRWKQTEEALCGPPPNGPGSIAMLRLVVMAQGDSKRVLSAFQALRQQDREQLEVELAVSGCSGQSYRRESSQGLCPVSEGGPAILVYYAPALMQKAGAADPLGALVLLADIFRQARGLFPVQKGRANETVLVRIDALKELQVKAIRQPSQPGDVWVLHRTSSKEAHVHQVNLMRNNGKNIDWDTSRVLFVHEGRLSSDAAMLRSRSGSFGPVAARAKFQNLVRRRMSFSPSRRRPPLRTNSLPPAAGDCEATASAEPMLSRAVTAFH
jgi:hypothetical protein